MAHTPKCPHCRKPVARDEADRECPHCAGAIVWSQPIAVLSSRGMEEVDEPGRWIERRDCCVRCGYRRTFPFGSLAQHVDVLSGRSEKVCDDCMPKFIARNDRLAARRGT